MIIKSRINGHQMVLTSHSLCKRICTTEIQSKPVFVFGAPIHPGYINYDAIFYLILLYLFLNDDES